MSVCVVPGCVALVDEPGVCGVHRQLPADELCVLLKRGVGLVAPLRSVVVGVEYERSDGSRYGYDHEGAYYEVEAGKAKPRIR